MSAYRPYYTCNQKEEILCLAKNNAHTFVPARMLHTGSDNFMNRLLQNHWFDHQVNKLLQSNGFLSAGAQDIMQETCFLAAEGSGSRISILLLPDYQTRSFYCGEPLHPEVLEQLADLGHLLKEVEPEFGLRFSEEAFFKKSSLWTAIEGFRYFNYAEIKSENQQTLAWLCVLDTRYRQCHRKDHQLLEKLGHSMLKTLLLNYKLEVSGQIQQNLIHFTAHDLRNPLAGILSLSEHIPAMQDNPKELKEISLLIQQSARRSLNMLEEILRSGHLESGKIQLKVSPGSFHQVLMNAIRQHQPDAQKKGQQIMVELEETETMALMDYARMSEILDNLFSNAVKYAPHGAGIEAKTNFIKEYGLLEFSLYNPGVGLSEDDKSRIFQKFSRLSARPTGGESSTGLGLSIARTLTEMHGGSIRAESEGIDKGVRFILQIPVSQVA